MFRILPLFVALMLGFVVLTLAGVTAEMADVVYVVCDSAPGVVALVAFGVLVAGLVFAINFLGALVCGSTAGRTVYVRSARAYQPWSVSKAWIF